jgi:hypothetical protein
MPHLDLFKERKYSTLKLGDGKEYKLPAEFTVEEVERVLEIREETEALEEEEVIEGGKVQREKHAGLLFAQLEVMFQHYQPDMTAKKLKKIVTLNDAMEILGFFTKYRHLVIKELKEEANSKEGAKKKLNASKELRDLRRMLSFMVVFGFSLLDLRKLYIDELHDFYTELIFTLEERGELKKGSYNNVRAKLVTPKQSSSDTVSSLRSQMLKAISGMNKPKKK